MNPMQVVCSILAAAIVAMACGSPDVASPPAPPELRARHVVFITLDTTRADHFGFMGNSWIRTPRLDSLAAESVVFTDHETVVPTTLASHTSLFTGKYPHHHGTPGNGWMVNQANLMLAEILKDAGFRTAGFLGSFALDSRFAFAQGFDHFDESFDLMVGEDGSDQNQRSAKSVTDAVITYLDSSFESQQGSTENLFLFAHYFDPHRHYLDRGPFLDRYRKMEIPLVIDPRARNQRLKALAMARRYAGEISYMDHHVGRLLVYLEQRGILDDAILVLTCDHGENFAEHREPFDHGIRVYGSATRVLWLMRMPGGELAGTRLDLPTSSIDVLPTLLRELGLPVPENIDGRPIDLRKDNLEANREANALADRSRFSQGSRSGAVSAPDPVWSNRNKARSIRKDGWKLIQTPLARREELYHLEDDPHEQRNLLVDPTPEHRARADALATELEAWAASAQPLPSEREHRQDQETIERLRALGYIVE